MGTYSNPLWLRCELNNLNSAAINLKLITMATVQIFPFQPLHYSNIAGNEDGRRSSDEHRDSSSGLINPHQVRRILLALLLALVDLC